MLRNRARRVPRMVVIYHRAPMMKPGHAGCAGVFDRPVLSSSNPIGAGVMADGYLRSAPVQTIALVGSYVPRQCGIATFGKDLRDAVASEIGQRQASVVAID